MAVDRDALGVCAQILATFLAAVAYAVQKKSHSEVALAGDGRSVYSTRLWRFGFFLMVCMAVIDVWSFSLLDQTKLAAFGAVTLAWNIVVAGAYLKESFTRIDAIAVSIIATGTILMLLSAGTSVVFTMPDILAHLHDAAVYAYVPISLLFILFSGIFVELTTRVSPDELSVPRARALMVLAPVTGGMCMSYTGYATKTISTVIFGGEWSQFGEGPLYVYFLMVAVALVFQVRYLNKGLEYFDAMVVVPIFQSAIILANSLAGIVFFGDLRNESAAKKFLFCMGAACSMAGVCVLMLKTKAAGAGAAAVHELGHQSLPGDDRRKNLDSDVVGLMSQSEKVRSFIPWPEPKNTWSPKLGGKQEGGGPHKSSYSAVGAVSPGDSI
jgi:hypothetical protein